MPNRRLPATTRRHRKGGELGKVMALFDRQRPRARRVDPRKLKGDGLRGLLGNLAEARNLVRLAVLLLLVGGTLVLMHTPYEPPRYRKGDRAAETIVARVDFSFPNETATNENRKIARLETPRVYTRSNSSTKALQEEFARLVRAATEIARPPKPKPGEAESGQAEKAVKPPAETTGDQEKRTPAPAPAAEADQEAGKQSDQEKAKKDERAKALAALKKTWKLTEEEFGQLVEIVKDEKGAEGLLKQFNSVISFIDGLAILSNGDFLEERPPKTENKEPKDVYFYILADERLVGHNKDMLLNVEHGSTERVVARKAEEAFAPIGLSWSLRSKLKDRLVDTLTANLTRDEQRTKTLQDLAAQKVKPVMRVFRRKDVLVASDDEIGDDEMRVLTEEHAAYLAQLSVWGRIGAVGGSILLVALLVFLMVAFTTLYQPNVINRPVRAFILVVLLLSVVAVAKFAPYRPPLAVFQLITVAMIITIAYNRRFALVAAWMMALLAALAARLTYGETLLLIAGSSVAVLQLGEIRTRSKPIRVGFVTGLVNTGVVWALALWNRQVAVEPMLGDGGLAFAYGLLPGFIVLGGLPFIERAFSVVTNISLLEFCDANQPALKKLAIEAPGTYSHSLLLGSIVEPAAEAIGANGLLARVGAYFHDIGKANKPHYFTENRDQLGDAPDHDKLTPQMSKLIITSHIKDGLDMAQQYGLPRAINAFIAEHHGTTVIEYFYYEALKSSDEPVDDTEFRYPGPKPHSKETAILMLADSCEGAVRSIKEPTPSKIEDRVRDIVMKRLLDGQLSESNLSLNEVYAVRQSLTKSLISVRHGRIAYPDQHEEAEAKGAPAAKTVQGESTRATSPAQSENSKPIEGRC